MSNFWLQYLDLPINKQFTLLNKFGFWDVYSKSKFFNNWWKDFTKRDVDERAIWGKGDCLFVTVTNKSPLCYVLFVLLRINSAFYEILHFTFFKLISG